MWLNSATPVLRFFVCFSTRRLLFPQALSLKEAEKTVLSDRVSSLQAELSAAALEAERMSREAAHYREQEQVMWLPVCVCLFSPLTYLP